MSENRKHTVELKPEQFDFLTRMTKKYDLQDESKALRCLINFAIEASGQEKEIFDEIRCTHC
ncbi:MAG TPA: hypothetical protein VF017_04115 [Thermoanaerobaculia bacterium]|nr:hypothetical protein [Thermoanaerobaculia bacterium]